jgi:pimeloyl-ACP methyl ester carboxylesterase
MNQPLPPVRLNTQLLGSGFPILCLHGHPGSGQSLAVFTHHLSDRFRTIAPDLRGYGNSQVSQPFAMTDHLTDLEALLAEQRVDQCLILGWSLGGILALELALRWPDRVRGLILVATSARPWGDHPAISVMDNINTGIAGLVNALAPGWMWNIETFGKRSLFRYLVQQHTPQTYQYLAEAALPAYLKTSGHATRALYAAIQTGYNRLPDLTQIHCPCLVLAGEADRHITAASSREMLKVLPQATFHSYPNTAHLFPWEIPDRVQADIDRWLGEQSFGTALARNG